ncbi:HNH endonuclease signature motif containing protein [Brevibacterium otitidis]|uniref:DUF222 domain-containing protein n=1 Tax=Brevibacterium otitidis TaxID=53364 RepID=A0ABV5X0F4_9MICO|nr:hypothetical protein GCM10023233_26280 [Brevibacterium otitidis]
MTADSVSSANMQPGEAHPEFLDAADIEQLKMHCPEVLSAIDALDSASSTMTDNAAVDSAAAFAIGKGLELVRRKLEAATARSTRLMTEQIEPSRYGVRKLPALLKQRMRITSHEARRRLSMARTLTGERTATGESIPARLPHVADCLQAGTISVDQTQAIMKQVDSLPPQVRAEYEPAVERVLLENAPSLRVEEFRVLGNRIRGYLDPDGRLATEPSHPNDYFVTVNQKANGDWILRGLLDSTTGLTLNALLTNRSQNPAQIVDAVRGAGAGTGETTAPEVPGTDAGTAPEAPGTGAAAGAQPREHLDATGFGFLDADGASAGPPAPAPFADSWTDEGCRPNAAHANGSPTVAQIFDDSRPDGARRHDRFSVLITRGACEPTGAGSYALVVTATADQVARGEGEVEAAGGHTRLEDVLQLSPGGRFYYASTAPGTREVRVRTEARFATPTQMTLLKARDRGCSFPDCDIPVGWCEAHHMRAHRHGGPTDLDNLTLLCRFHHGWHEKHGWRSVMLNGFPAWIPPQTLDRDQRPIFHSRFRAELHDPDTLFPD